MNIQTLSCNWNRGCETYESSFSPVNEIKLKHELLKIFFLPILSTYNEIKKSKFLHKRSKFVIRSPNLDIKSKLGIKSQICVII